MAALQPTVLVVDDQDFIRDTITQALSQLGYLVVSCANGTELLNHCEGLLHIPALLIVDVSLPDGGGLALLKKVQGLFPEIKALFISGYSPDMLCAAYQESKMPYLQKPFSLDTLYNKVGELLGPCLAQAL